MTAEKEGKVVQKEYDLRIQALQNDVKVLIAEIGTKAQAETERNEMFLEVLERAAWRRARSGHGRAAAIPR